MSPSGGVAKPAPSSMSTADEVPPPPVNGRTSFGRAGSSGNLPATCSYGSTCYVGPFGHVGTDPEADPAAATIGEGANPLCRIDGAVSCQFCGSTPRSELCYTFQECIDIPL